MRRFDDEDLTGAEFRECDLSRARLVGVVMQDVKIDGLVTNLVVNNIGWDRGLLGDYQRALVFCRQALAMFEEIDGPPWPGSHWDSIGYAHHHLGEHAEAVACYQHALDLFRDLGDAHHAAGDPRPPMMPGTSQRPS